MSSIAETHDYIEAMLYPVSETGGEGDGGGGDGGGGSSTPGGSSNSLDLGAYGNVDKTVWDHFSRFSHAFLAALCHSTRAV